MTQKPKSSFGRFAIISLASLVSVYFAIQLVAVTFVSDAAVTAMVLAGTLLMLGVRYLLKKSFRPFIYVLLFSVFTGGVHTVTICLLLNNFSASGVKQEAGLPCLRKGDTTAASWHSNPYVVVQLEGVPKEIKFTHELIPNVVAADSLLLRYSRGLLGMNIMDERVIFLPALAGPKK